MPELIDPKPKTVVLEPKAIVPAPEPASYKDSDTQVVASARMCWHQKLGDALLDS